MALPIALDGKDLTGQARTGTGKTLAFGVAMLQRIDVAGDDRRPQGLVVAPTRELALQVSDDLTKAGAGLGARVTTLYGGRPYEPQIRDLRRGVDVVVGTPGRLLDLARQRHLDLSDVRVLVLDEADRMLDLGFLPDVERILALTPDQRQTMLFSATMPTQIVGLARRYLRSPVNIRAEQVEENRTVPQTRQHVYRTHPMDKREILARLLQAEQRGRTMVFCRTKRTADRLAQELGDRGFAATAVHGDLGQQQRERALRDFRRGKADVLVATDVAARGLDVEDVTHVVNYECPADENEYLHRTGRTGRARRAGIAVTFVDWADIARWKVINAALGLPFPDPPETYSTSGHLYEQLSIPRDASGRVAGHESRPRSDAHDGRPRGRGGRRRRLRAGQPVEQVSATQDRHRDDRGTADHGAARRRRSRGRGRGGRS
ncbi:MAG: DEAD/DEAH box helicase [Streptosporangiaceae bacterium]